MSSAAGGGGADVFKVPLKPTKFGDLTMVAHTHMGARKNQEDRFVFSPNLADSQFCFMGVFDGTVQEHASEWVHHYYLDILMADKSMLAFLALDEDARLHADNWALIDQALHDSFLETDRQLLVFAAKHAYHYTSSTGVVALIYLPARQMFVAHVGDSHAVLGLSFDGDNGGSNKQPDLQGEYLTVGHKADTKEELDRIEKAGGQLVYLHGGKPFIRGGDFKQRNHAMQLNYSRAFGGKDLKMYGLSCVPDVSRVSLRETQKGVRPVSVILASDGLWDVVDPTDAVRICTDAHTRWLQNPSQPTCSEVLVTLGLKMHEQKRTNDNVTNIVCLLEW